MHPQYICVLCERALKRARGKASFCGGGCGIAVKWIPHQRINCTNHTAKARGKRQVAIKPSTQLRRLAAICKHGSQQGSADAAASTTISGMDETEEQVLKRACKAHRASTLLAPGRFIDKEAVQIRLKCNMAVDNAIQAACCEELFCANCICQWLAANNKCPACSAEMKASPLCQPGRAATRLIGILSIRCDFYTPSLEGCPHVVPLHQLQGRQVYHGGAFIGNHVHRALKPTVVTAICRSHIPVIEDRCASLLPAASRIASRYEKLLNGYAACRAIFSHCESIGDESLERLQSEIEEFLKTCREEIVARRLGNITPKLHLLEEHTVPLIRKLHVGLGLLAEQGAESLHSNLNTLNVIFKNIPNSLARLRTVAEQHLLTTTSEASTLSVVGRCVFGIVNRPLGTSAALRRHNKRWWSPRPKRRS